MKAVAEKLEPTAAKAAPCGNLCGFAQRHPVLGSAAAVVTARGWAAASVRDRLRVLRVARHAMAAQSEAFVAAISPELARSSADTLAAELLPLLDACKFLEREAERLLRPRWLGMRGRPLWLTGVWAEIHREPLGHVLVIGPANFPLFVPGVQVLQALAAGNRVTWKPGAGGVAVGNAVAQALFNAGLPGDALTVTDDTVDAARGALARGADKVVFTGSTGSGGAVMADLAQSRTPAVMELSGADAIVVMPSADLEIVARAVAFGLRLNGGAVCISPRRLFATPATMALLRPRLEAELVKAPPVHLAAETAARLDRLLKDAQQAGAVLRGQLQTEAQRPLLVDMASPRMEITRSDLFAPVISLIETASMLHVPEAYAECDYALSAAIFCGRGNEADARAMARVLKAGTVLINDVIAPTADARVPFGGRGASGYGVTRGAEGLLEMTAVKTLLVRRARSKTGMRHLEPTRHEDAPLFAAMIEAAHGGGLARRWTGLRQIIKLSLSK